MRFNFKTRNLQNANPGYSDAEGPETEEEKPARTGLFSEKV